MKKSRLLIVDDEPNILDAFSSLLSDEGHATHTAESAEQATRACDRHDFDLILLDLQLPGQSGLDFLRDLRRTPTAPKVLVVSGQADIAAALEAVRLGAVDFLEKPVPPEKLVASVSAALALASAEKQRSLLVEEIEQRCRIAGESKAVRDMNSLVARMAVSDATVLITGQNGTGKELVATRLYLQSDRREAPFLKVNCPGIPETLFESELFGHAKGSFTGAVRDHPGKFRMADGGTLFLDEIGELPLACQAKLLRVLETGEVETLGAEEPHQVNVRIICATNRDLKKFVETKGFREDLYYRISVLAVEVPPLARRVDDIPLLTGEFLRQFDPGQKHKLSPAAVAFLCSQDYPGNVRQLRNLIERLTILAPEGVIDAPTVAAQFWGGSTPAATGDSELSLTDQLARFERELIRQMLAECGENISEAARRLRMDRANLSRKIKEYDLKSSDQ